MRRRHRIGPPRPGRPPCMLRKKSRSGQKLVTRKAAISFDVLHPGRWDQSVRWVSSCGASHGFGPIAEFCKPRTKLGFWCRHLAFRPIFQPFLADQAKGLKVHIQPDVAPGQVGIHGLEVLDEISALLKRVGSQILPRGRTHRPAFNRLEKLHGCGHQLVDVTTPDAP